MLTLLTLLSLLGSPVQASTITSTASIGFYGEPQPMKALNISDDTIELAQADRARITYVSGNDLYQIWLTSYSPSIKTPKHITEIAIIP